MVKFYHFCQSCLNDQLRALIGSEKGWTHWTHYGCSTLLFFRPAWTCIRSKQSWYFEILALKRKKKKQFLREFKAGKNNYCSLCTFLLIRNVWHRWLNDFLKYKILAMFSVHRKKNKRRNRQIIYTFPISLNAQLTLNISLLAPG